MSVTVAPFGCNLLDRKFSLLTIWLRNVLAPGLAKDRAMTALAEAHRLALVAQRVPSPDPPNQEAA